MTEYDDRPKDIIAEFPMRKIPLNLCVCHHGNEDHQTEVTFADLADGACEKCVCKKFVSLIEVAMRRRKQ